jgi:U3 small nucleolar RNA-associated protein 23
MRHGRAKAARKTLQFFARQGVTPPFVVLVDGTFLVQAMVHKVPIIERIEKLLQHARFTLQVARSSLKELEVLARHVPEAKRDAIAHARQWGLDECEIIEGDVPKVAIETEGEDLGIPGQDIGKLVQSHAHSYVVATQDEALLNVLRNRGECPLLRLSRGVLLLENPSKAAQNRARYQEQKKYSHSAVNQSERQLAKSVKDETRQEQQSMFQQTTRTKRKAKGPNPLSCKKKKSSEASGETTHQRKRRRKGNTSSS